jgi:hypothetical protein
MVIDKLWAATLLLTFRITSRIFMNKTPPRVCRKA